MKKHFYLLLLPFLLLSLNTFAQSWKWAYTAHTTPRSQSVAIKEDHSGNFYLATFTDSITTRLYTTLEKHDANQQMLWQKQITGDVTISDIEINAANHAIAVGYFKGNISVDGNPLTSFSPADNSGFIFECDESGMIIWVHDLNPVNGDFKPGELYIALNGDMYITSQVSGNFGFCAFHQLDASGNIIKNEFNNNFENRTFSHILTDADNNVYLSGTCGFGANFDSIAANPNFSYQNFLVKYDSSFKAQWLITREYVTFDDNNGIGTDGQSLYWAFNEFTSNADTSRIIKCDYNGQITNSIDGPLSAAFFPAIDFKVDRLGNSVLLLNTFVRFFIYRYDPALNMVWQDTIYTNTSGFPLNAGLTCYDSSFYLTSFYQKDTLLIDNFTLINPNTTGNYRTDIFVAKWSNNQVPVSVNETQNNHLLHVFPIPSGNEIHVTGLQSESGDVIKMFDASGKMIISDPIKSSALFIDISGLSNGIYFLKLMSADNLVKTAAKIVKMH